MAKSKLGAGSGRNYGLPLDLPLDRWAPLSGKLSAKALAATSLVELLSEMT